MGWRGGSGASDDQLSHHPPLIMSGSGLLSVAMAGSINDETSETDLVFTVKNDY